MSDVFLYLAGLGIAGYFFWFWLEDYRDNAQRIRDRRTDHEGSVAGSRKVADEFGKGMPGATPARWGAIVVAVLGALLILGTEVAGEYQLGVVADQSTMSILFGIYTLAAAFIEELIFSWIFIL